jgi:hypothetical protein
LRGLRRRFDGVYAPMSRLAHDTAFSFASALTEKMDYRLADGEQQAFHRLVYDTCKGAIERHDVLKGREREG